MKKKEKLFNENGKDIFEFNFGFNFPKATWKMLERIDTRTKKNGKQRKLTKKRKHYEEKKIKLKESKVL